MSSVYLWVDPASESSFAALFHHTTICVVFQNDLKYLFSYNENGLSCIPASGQATPTEEIFLGRTMKTLPEVMIFAQNLHRTKFKNYSPLGRNCNDFSNTLSLWLCDQPIPDKYLYQDLTVASIVFGTLAVIGAIFSR